MTIFDALKRAESEIGSGYVAREIVKFHTGFDDTKLILSLKESLKDKNAFLMLVLRYKKGEPLEYITKKAGFLDSEFYVESGVLIPRFETEILVNDTANCRAKIEFKSKN